MKNDKDLLDLGFKSGKWFEDALAYINEHALSGADMLAYLDRMKPAAPPLSELITLTKTEKAELNTLFQFQLDKEAGYLAAFMPENSHDEAAYIEKYSRFLTDPTITMRTIKVDEIIVGSVAKFVMKGEAELTYWIDRKFWGQGIATAVLMAFLKIEQVRPICGRVAVDNYGSQKVLEKCGFLKISKDKGFANARQMEVEEFIYKLT